MIRKVEYWIADYHGFVDVSCDPDDDNDIIYAKAKAELRRICGELPYGSYSFKVVNTD